MSTIVHNVLALYDINLVYLCGKFYVTSCGFPQSEICFLIIPTPQSSAATDVNNNIQVCHLSNTNKNHCPRGIPWKISVHPTHIFPPSLGRWNTDSLELCFLMLLCVLERTQRNQAWLKSAGWSIQILTVLLDKKGFSNKPGSIYQVILQYCRV